MPPSRFALIEGDLLLALGRRAEALDRYLAVAATLADDPPIGPEGERANTAVWSWHRMIRARDLLFLITDLDE